MVSVEGAKGEYDNRRQVVALYLIYLPDQGFLFEERLNPYDPLYGQVVIPGGKAENPGEINFPLWAAQAECLEERGVFPEIVIPLELVDDKRRGISLCPFIFTGKMWGFLGINEPEKNRSVFMPWDQVFRVNEELVEVSPRFQVQTTRLILLDAYEQMKKYELF